VEHRIRFNERKARSVEVASLDALQSFLEARERVPFGGIVRRPNGRRRRQQTRREQQGTEPPARHVSVIESALHFGA
jgi:hypothetical protein